MSAAVQAILTQKVLEMIEKGTAPWRRPWVQTSKPRSVAMTKGQHYRGSNYFLLGMVSAVRGLGNCWATFNMIKERGGKIKDGHEKDYYPVFYYTGPLEDESGNMRPGYFRYSLVYNMDFVEGIKVEDGQNAKTHEPIEACERIVNGYKDAPVIHHKGDVACYYPAIDVIHMPVAQAFVNPESYYSTLFHEMGHSTGHSGRQNRPELQTLNEHHAYSLEELVAELTAVFLCDEAGIVNSQIENSAAYLQGWYKALKNDPKMFHMAASRAQKAADLILGN